MDDDDDDDDDDIGHGLYVLARKEKLVPQWKNSGVEVQLNLNCSHWSLKQTT
jgi:hypothetical protein